MRLQSLSTLADNKISIDKIEPNAPMDAAEFKMPATPGASATQPKKEFQQ